MMKTAIAAMVMGAALVVAAPASAATFDWTGGGDFDDGASTVVPGTAANYVQFFGTDEGYGEGFTGPFAHTHGQDLTWSIFAKVDGVARTIFSQSIGGTGEDVGSSVTGLGRIGFAGGEVTEIGFNCVNCSGNTYHQFNNVTFELAEQAVAAVPEPATWALMIGGFGMVGGTLRRRATVRTRVRFA